MLKSFEHGIFDHYRRKYVSLIQCDNLKLQFSDNIIFEDKAFQIEKGEKVLIHGSSGSGKSSFLKMLIGFMPYQGVIYLQEKKMNAKRFRESRILFAYVNQEVSLRQGILKEVIEEMASYRWNTLKLDAKYGLDPELCEYFRLPITVVSKAIDSLSGGERQRVSLILAMMLNRPIFLLDEVTASLDAELKKKVVDYFAETDKTVLAVSHDSYWQEVEAFRKVKW